MIKTININGRECTFKTSGALPRIYRVTCKRDIFRDINELKKAKDEEVDLLETDAIEVFEDVAYCMALHGDPDTPNDIIKWLEKFKTFELLQHFEEIIKLWNEEMASESVEKKESD